MTLWLYVTNDELELPIIVADSVKELAEKMGVTASNIYSNINGAKYRGGNSRYKRVIITTEEE